jgi:hypothetical protein
MTEVNLDSLLKAVEKLADQLEMNNAGKFHAATIIAQYPILMSCFSLITVRSFIKQCKIG